MIEIISGRFKVDKDFYLKMLGQHQGKLLQQGKIVIKFGSEKEAQELNRRFRKRDYATDVLSFPYGENICGENYLGDIFICLPLARRQAKEQGHTMRREILTLIIHGILHLQGYDHETDSGEMDQLQMKILSEFKHGKVR